MNGREREKRWVLEEKYAGHACSDFWRDCDRLERGEPVDYVIGWKPFLDCEIGLSRRPLIPRAETEFWTEKILTLIAARSFPWRARRPARTIRCLDMCAGSGCVGIAILKHITGATVDFADSDDTCLRQIEENCARNSIVFTRYRALRSDLFEKIRGRYDFILCNPPYIARSTAAERVALPVLCYEPLSALFGGDDGLALIRQFLTAAPTYLMPGGMAALEFDDTQKKRIEGYIKNETSLTASFQRDQFGDWRWLIARSRFS